MKKIILLVGIFGFSFVSHGGELIEFQPNTPAKAAEVNSNFSELESRINNISMVAGPRGEQGAQGVAGPQGEQGPKGEQGLPGDNAWNVYSNNIYYSDGNVGIGTSDPLSKLAIKGLPSSAPDSSGIAGVVCVTNDGNLWLDSDGVSDCKEGRTFIDNQGGVVTTTCGEGAYASEVMDYTVGSPAPAVHSQTPSQILGFPDYSMNNSDTGAERGFVTLGCYGSIIVRFAEGVTDLEGSDLHVFEVGEGVEPTNIQVSVDGVNWVDVGNVSGGTASLDLNGKVSTGEVYYYVKLTDLGSGCSRSDFAGADIDSILVLSCP